MIAFQRFSSYAASIIQNSNHGRMPARLIKASPNFQAFAEQAEALTGHKVIQIERISDDGAMTPLDGALDGVDGVENLRRFWANTIQRLARH
jgi:hypothetical protein